MSNIAKHDQSAVLQHMQEANTQLSNEVRKLKASEYKKLFQQTRSFIDALERCPLSRHRSYGPSILTIRQVQDCFHVSQKLDGERKTHYTILLGYFLHLSDTLRQLAVNAREWLGEPVEHLTVHPHQLDTGSKILAELSFWEKFLNEDNDFTDLHKYKTLEEFRGLNTGEVSIYGAVVNLLPVILKTMEGITDEVTKWSNITYRLGVRIFKDNPKSLLAPEPVQPSGSRSGSRAGSRPASASSGQRPASRASVTNQRPSSRNSALERPATAAARPPSRQGTTVGTQTNFSRQASREKTKTRVTSAPPSRRTYSEQLAARYNGKISLYERPPWKPSSTMPHNLYPRLHIHLPDTDY
ncbi:uncharacterized protein [Ptychodera flava]|uniref:uncharacterized protein n=1 Tax=Ptychodera flava TaxID=63121 RepID=UPI00396A3AFC